MKKSPEHIAFDQAEKTSKVGTRQLDKRPDKKLSVQLAGGGWPNLEQDGSLDVSKGAGVARLKALDERRRVKLLTLQ